MTTITEGRHPGEFILSEGNFHISRGNVTIAAAQEVPNGGLISPLAVAANVDAVASADAGNTASSGTIAMTAPATTGEAKNGRYVGVASAATKVDWADPNGVPLGVSTHGTAFAKGGIKFTITAGGTPNVVGDKFYVDVLVEEGDVEYVAYNQDGTDGSQFPTAIAIYGATTGVSETKQVSAIQRQAEVKGGSLSWPVGITAAEKSSAAASLGKSGIIVR